MLPLLPELVTLAQRATVTNNFGATQTVPASMSNLASGASFTFVPGSPLPSTAICTGSRPMHVEFARDSGDRMHDHSPSAAPFILTMPPALTVTHVQLTKPHPTRP